LEGKIKGPVERIISLIDSLDFDPLIQKLEVVHPVNDRLNIGHIVSRSPVPFLANRDFAVLRVTHKEESPIGRCKWVLGATSIETHFVPLQPNLVRGEMVQSGWIVENLENGDEHCFVTYVLCLDIKGWVPNHVVKHFRIKDLRESFDCLKMAVESTM